MRTPSSQPTTPATIPAGLRARIMARAWEIFRASYNYPRVPFRSIGRACFAWALRAAWAEARETVRLAASGAKNLKRWISDLNGSAHATGLATSHTHTGEALLRRSQQRRAFVAALAFSEAV